MALEEKISEFVKRAREAARENLVSVVLYGSAASGEFHNEFSDVNLFCVLRDGSFGALQRLAPAAQWWAKQRQPAPIVMTRDELLHSADVFAIELLDMQQHHRVLHGEDVIRGLEIPASLHREQVEYELREKFILLRQQLLLAGDNRKNIGNLLLRSLPSFVTLFRHALIAMGRGTHSSKRDALRQMNGIGVDASALEQLMDVRERKAQLKNLDVQALATKYVSAIEQVTAAVAAKAEQ